MPKLSPEYLRIRKVRRALAEIDSQLRSIIVDRIALGLEVGLAREHILEAIDAMNGTKQWED